MSKILALYPDLPSNTKAAGHKSAFQTLEELYSLGHELHLVAFDSTGVIDSDLCRLHIICKSLNIIKIDTTQKFLNCLRHPYYPPLISSRISTHLICLLEKLVENIDIIHIEFSQMLFYVRYLKNRYPDKKLFFYAHDILTQRSFREARKYWFLNPIKTVDYLVTLLTESNLLSYADRIIAFNDKDAAMMERFYQKINIIPLFTSGAVFELPADAVRENKIVFFGAMNRKENYLAVIDFINKAWPLIRDKHPLAKLLIIGANPHHSLLKYNNAENVHITGFIDNPYAYISSATVTVAPIKLGAGLKVKVLESLFCGCPVVAFPAGSEGIDLERSEGLITVSGYPELVDEVSFIMSGRVRYDPIHVRNSVARKFNWQVSIEFWKRYYQ